MRSIGVRELKAHTSTVLREVREKGQPVEVTIRGRPVARLVPIEPVRSTPGELSAVWADLDHVAAEIGARWPVDVSAADAVREMRREL
jgi:prevent-host-death family protein